MRRLAEESHIMGMPATPPPLLTVDDFFALPEDHSRKYELFDGVLVVSPEPRIDHQVAVSVLGRELAAGFAAAPSLRFIAASGEVQVGERTVVAPDLLAIPRPPKGTQHWRELAEPPVLAVEVLSPSTAYYDRGIKREWYQRAGVAEYWIVDLDARLLERWTLGDERPQMLRGTFDWELKGGAAGSLDLPAIFAEILDG